MSVKFSTQIQYRCHSHISGHSIHSLTSVQTVIIGGLCCTQCLCLHLWFYYVLLILLALLCISSVSFFSLRGLADRESSDVKVCFGFRDWGGLAGGPESRSLAWAAGLHPVPEILLLGELPLWLKSQGLICCSEELITGGMFTLQVLNELRSSAQLSAEACIQKNKTNKHKKTQKYVSNIMTGEKKSLHMFSITWSIIVYK